VEYKLYDASFVPQLSRILGSASDDKAAYVISLAEGKTEQDLLACLNTRPSGSGYYFDTSRLTSDLGVLLGTGNDCVRNLVHDILSFSKCNITCSVAGTPTHVILGGIAPFVFEIGKDVKLLSVTTGTSVDKTGIGSVVSVAAFKLKFTAMDFINFTSLTIGSINFRQAYGDPRYRDFDDYQKQLVRQIGKGDFKLDFSFYGLSVTARAGLLCMTSEIGTNRESVDGISIGCRAVDQYNFVIYVMRAAGTTSEILTTAPARIEGVALSLRRVNGITKLYVNGAEVPLYALTDSYYATPLTYNLDYDLSTVQVCRIGYYNWQTGDSTSFGYQVNNVALTKL